MASFYMFLIFWGSFCVRFLVLKISKLCFELQISLFGGVSFIKPLIWGLHIYVFFYFWNFRESFWVWVLVFLNFENVFWIIIATLWGLFYKTCWFGTSLYKFLVWFCLKEIIIYAYCFNSLYWNKNTGDIRNYNSINISLERKFSTHM